MLYKEEIYGCNLHYSKTEETMLGFELNEMGIMRCHGRFTNADLDENTKLLPRYERFTTLLISQVHQQLIHTGVAHTLAQIGKEYLIPQGRAQVKALISRCVIF